MSPLSPPLRTPLPGNCIYSFNPKIDAGVYKLHHALFFNSFYNINETNNKIYFSESAGPVLTATLQNGYYDSSTIAANIDTQMQAVAVNTYTVTLSTTTNKLTITPNTGTLKFWFGTYTDNSAKNVLGFIGDTASSSSLTSDNPINLTDTLSLNVRLEGHGIQNYLQDNSSNFYSFSIPVSSNSKELVLYEPLHPQFVKLENPLSDIRVRVLNEDGDSMLLYNDFYFVLERVHEIFN